MIASILTCVGMLLVTILIHYLTFRTQKYTNFWTGTSVIFIICILGLFSRDTAYFSAIIGYIVGCEVSEQVGWRKRKG